MGQVVSIKILRQSEGLPVCSDINYQKSECCSSLLECAEDRIGKLFAFLPHQSQSELAQSVAAATHYNSKCIQSSGCDTAVEESIAREATGTEPRGASEWPGRNNIVPFPRVARVSNQIQGKEGLVEDGGSLLIMLSSHGVLALQCKA